MAGRVNELNPELLGVAALNPFLMHDSSSRLAMFCSHISQSLVVNGATVKRTLTMVEREYAKYTHSIKMPCNANIIKVVEKYSRTLGTDSVVENPTYTIIYENTDHPLREVGVLHLDRHHCIHQYFGFKYTFRPIVRELRPGMHIAAGTILADSPSVTEEGDYKYGVGVQVALMPLPGVIEDGVIISRQALKRFTTMGYGVRTLSWGKNRYPLNLYGNEQHYKPFPDIGERIHSDGLLIATRRYDEMLAVTDMTPEALTRPTQFDKTIYGIPNAKVVDVIVRKGSNLRTSIPTGMSEQCLKYFRKTQQYHENLLHEYYQLKGRRKESLSLSPEFNRLLVESMAMTNADPKSRIIHTMNGAPIDEWMVDIIFEYEIVPTTGFKFTCCHGGKGVVVQVRDEADMPVDADGNRAEIVMDADSNIKRMNIGRVVEQLINASARATQLRLSTMLGNRTAAEVTAAWEYLMGFYKIISPRMHEAIIASGTEARRLEHMEDVVADGIYLYTPTDTPVEYSEACWELAKQYPPCYKPVTYRGNSGDLVTTEQAVLIGEMYFLMLEKIGNTWSAVASPKLQHFGIPAKLTNADKYSSPGRENPVRIMGESEVRLFASVIGGDATSEILDQTNNPEAHRFIINAIYHANKPTDIRSVIDRKLVPRGNGRVVSYVRHIMECSGMEFVDGSKI